MSNIHNAKTRPPWMDPIRWLYVLAWREALRGRGRCEIGTDGHARQSAEASKVFHRMLKRRGIKVEGA